MSKLLNERQAAHFLDCSEHKLQKDRRQGSPIPYLRIGRNIRYRLSDLEDYLEKQTFRRTSEYGGSK